MPLLSYIIDHESPKTESSPPINWPVVPREGEHIETEDSRVYKVTRVVHMVRRTESDIAKILLYVEDESRTTRVGAFR